jgi:hypothetical protein
MLSLSASACKPPSLSRLPVVKSYQVRDGDYSDMDQDPGR